MRIILASASPRRREILARAGIRFEVIPSEADETVRDGMAPEEVVRVLSRRKNDEVYGRLRDDGAFILSADTIVSCRGEILGKPADEADAYRMISLLSGSRHEVLTGYTMRYGGKVFTGCEVTAVLFKELTEEQKRSYVMSGEPMDKAGGYAIQEHGDAFVERYIGDYDNVVGLPLAAILSAAREYFGVDPVEE